MYRKRLMATLMTLKRLLTAILLQYTLALPMQAQTVIEGNVTDSLHRAVDAYVTVAPKATASILDFADTDAKGHYRLSFSTAADSLVVTAAGLGIGQQVRTVPNRSQRVDFSVRQQAALMPSVPRQSRKVSALQQCVRKASARLRPARKSSCRKREVSRARQTKQMPYS
jgi:hypothetical protein